MTGSMSAEAGIPMQGVCGPSKGAVHQMTRQMPVEYAKYKIRVNAFECGTIDTSIVYSPAKASGNQARFWRMLRNNPIGRIGTLEEVTAFFWRTWRVIMPPFFTGAVLMMDGRYTAQ